MGFYDSCQVLCHICYALITVIVTSVFTVTVHPLDYTFVLQIPFTNCKINKSLS